MRPILEFAYGIATYSASLGRTAFSAPMTAQGMAGQSRARALVSSLKRLWAAYIIWRIERAAVDQLLSMSDRELKDIGLTRSQIPGAVRGGAASNSAFNRSF